MNPLIAPEAYEPAGPRGPTALSVNVNKIALLRNTRTVGLPDVVRLARLALQAGAQGITIHPRPDERHIRRQDALDLAVLMRDWPEAEFNIEGNPLHNLLPLAEAVVEAGGPVHQLTFVPDAVEQATSDHGWSLPQAAEALRPCIARGQSLGARISLFMDADPQAMPEAAKLGVERVELYAEAYARAFEAGEVERQAALARYAAAARAAQAVGLAVNAGHDLNQANLGAFLRTVPAVVEVSIGHALVAEALEAGLAETVRAYRRLMIEAWQEARRTGLA